MKYHIIWLLSAILAQLACHCKGTNGPEQVHISLGTNENEMVVTWTTTKNAVNEPSVHYGLNANKLAFVTKAEHTHFHEGTTSFHVYRALLVDLKPYTTYYYQVGSKSNLSEIFHFRTLQSGTEWLPHFAVYGDLGFLNERSLPYLSQDVEKNLLHTVFHIGDFAYDLPDNSGENGHDFMRSIQKVAARVPYMTCPGNHERYDNFSHYDARFSMIGDREHPNHKAPLTKRLNNHFYSLDIGPAHIVLFSTEYYYYTEYGWEQIERQYRWLDADLAKANKNRKQRPWIIVMGHRPLYCLKLGDLESCDTVHQDRPHIRKGVHMHNDKNSPLQYGLEELFFKHGVDIQLYGHEHFYGRLFPLYNFTIMNSTNKSNPYENPSGPIHLTTGSAGNKELHPEFNHHLKNWVADHFYDYGYTRFKFEARNHIVVQQISDDQHGKILDHIDIIKDTTHPKWMPMISLTVQNGE